MTRIRWNKQITMRVCKLCSLNNSHDPINLPHLEEITLGRSRLTDIRDSAVSRTQVKLVADLDSCLVKVTPLGVNPSGVNGFCLKRNSDYTLRHNDRLELLLDQYIYEILFDPKPSYGTKVSGTVKRKREDDVVNGNKQQKAPQKNNMWEEIDNKNLYIFTSEGVLSKEKIAGYDIDGTIITTKSGMRFGKDAYDWQFAFSEVLKKLRELHSNDYKVVFFTNQAGISTGKTKIGELKEKFENIIKKIGIPIQVFVAPTRTIYRKPAPGMWEALVNDKNDGVEIDIDNSFYVGDAAGREKDWAPKKKKDHSIADRLFALNIGLKFFTPEEHFLGARNMRHIMPAFDPRIDTDELPLCEPKDANIYSDKQELIIFVGGPGSGKSFFCKQYLVPKGYIHVNRDQLGSWQKCHSAMEKYLQENKSVVIDNTNPDIESRKRYLDSAKKLNIPCRCFVMNTSIHQAKHNNLFREMTDKSHQQITDIIINSYYKKLKEPTLSEGFTEVLKINCVEKFDDPEHRKLYKKFLLEK